MGCLFLRHNGGHVITVDGNVQIGRGRGERRDPSTWFTDRPKAPDFADLALVIDIDGSPTMSRNHAGIRREGETFTVQDLSSLNGTYRNGVRLEPGIHYSLAVGDCIGFGLDQLLVGDSPEVFAAEDAPEVRAARRAAVRPEWYLGVAGFDDDEDVQRAFDTSVARIAEELHRRGYQTEVHGIKTILIPQILGRAVGVGRLSEVLDSLNRRGYAASAEAHTFFQYSGHGIRDGLVVNNSEVLTPRMLFDAIGSVRGKKFLVLDACHAGVFLADPKRIPPQTAILAATRGVDAPAFAEGQGAAPEESDLPMTILSRRLWTLLHNRLGPVQILNERSALEDAFQQDEDGILYVQEPGMNTVTYTVCLKSIFLTGIYQSTCTVFNGHA